MLVLSRQRDESIIIGDNVQITIVDIRGDKVRLGIEAPSDVTVHRKEVFDAVYKEGSATTPENPHDVRPQPETKVPEGTLHLPLFYDTLKTLDQTVEDIGVAADRRRQIRDVMRYAGPRMLWRHPLSAIRHLWDGRRTAAAPPRKRVSPPPAKDSGGPS